ncbi:2-octaprenyl-6-methoxyphenol hydroxylase [Alteromonadaceae bacterium Bs31]|nr:2-octaprenyl-6-methoxyphenol hydroxylase [Alteromonadaceae bacterium Bs31]
MTQHCDIAIIGGGMVGLSQALLLAKHLPECNIVLLEAQPLTASEHPLQASFDERSTALSPPSVELLSSLGLWSGICARAEAIRHVHVSDRGHLGRTLFSERDNNMQALGYVVENRHFGMQLIQAVLAKSNIHVVAPARVGELRPKASGALITYEHQHQQQSLSTGLVIIGDGADSPLRTQLGIDVEEFDYQQYALVANLEFENPHDGQAFERFTEQGPIAVLPLPREKGTGLSRRCAMVWTRPESELEHWTNLPDAQFIKAVQNAFGYRLGAILRVGERKHYPLKMIFAREQIRSSMVFVGNAAHYLHPVAGQGFNLALRDCAQLTSVLCEAQALGDSMGDLKVLNRYLQQQQKDQKNTAFISHNFIRVFGSDKLALQGLRNLGLLSMELFGPMKREFFSQMMGRTPARASLHEIGGD